jgi:hypothetical protein
MTTLNKTFSVKNGVSVANTIIIDTGINISNINMLTMSSTLTVGGVDLYGLINNSPFLLTVFQVRGAFGGTPNSFFTGTNALDGGLANSNSVGSIYFNGNETLDCAENRLTQP